MPAWIDMSPFSFIINQDIVMWSLINTVGMITIMTGSGEYSQEGRGVRNNQTQQETTQYHIEVLYEQRLYLETIYI